MPLLSPQQLQEIYKVKGVQNDPAKMKKLYQVIKNSGFSVGNDSVQQNVDRQLSAIPQATPSFGQDIMQGAKNLGGYTLGAPLRLFGGTIKEGVGGLMDIGTGVKKLAGGDVMGAIGSVGQGVARTVSAPTSGLTSAVTGRTVGELAQSGASQVGQGVQRGFEGGAQMLGGLAQGVGALSRGDFGTGLEQAGDAMNIGRTKLIGGVSQAMFSPFTAATEKTPIGQLGGYVGQNFMEGMNRLGVDTSTEKGAAIAEAIGQIPMLAGGVKGIQMGALDKLPKLPGALKQAVKTPMQSVVKPALSTLGRTNRASLALQAKTASLATAPIRKLTSMVGGEAIRKLSGLNRESVSFLAKNPQIAKDILVKNVGREKNLELAVGSIKSLDDRVSSTGKEYANIRAIEKPIVFDKSPIQSVLEKYSIARTPNGKIKVDLDSLPLSPADQTALQSIVNLIGDKKTLTPKQLLNTRKHIDHLIKWDSGKSSEVITLGKELRRNINNVAHKQLPELKALDATYGPLRKELSGIKGKIFDKQGNLKDGATSVIANAVGKGKEGFLAKLEKLEPGITKKLQAVRVLEDMEQASANKVGAYTRGALTGGATFSAMTGNLPGAIGMLGVEAITHPQVLGRILVQYGIGKEKLGPITQRVNAYLKAGMTDVDAVVKAIGKGSSTAVQRKLEAEKESIKAYLKDLKKNTVQKPTRGSIQNPFWKEESTTSPYQQKNIETLNKNGIKVSSPEDIITVYHGTSAKNASSINKNGLNPQSYLATDKNATRLFAGEKGEVIEMKVPVKDFGFVYDGGMAGSKGVSIQTFDKLTKGADGVWRSVSSSQPKPKTPPTPTPHSTLLQEAKKYKSVDEFVKSQGTPVYHGTSLTRAENINKEGFKEIYSPRHYGAVKSPTTYFAETPDVAQIYAKDKAMAFKDKGAIVETFIDFNKGKQLDLTKKIPDWIKKHRDSKYNDLDMWDTTPTNVWSLLDNSKVKDLIQEKGYNIVRFKERGVDTLGNGIAVFDKTLIKTKQQLQEIYNQAHKGAKIDPLIVEAKKYESVDEFVEAQPTPKNVTVWIKSKFSKDGAYTEVPVIKKVTNKTLYQGGEDSRQFWTANKKYAEQFGKVKEKTGTFYQVDNGNRVIDVYVDAVKTTPQLTDIWNKAHNKN